MLNLFKGLISSGTSAVTGFFSQPIVYIFILLGAIITGLYFVNISYVKSNALAEYNKTQLEQNIKDQQEFISKQKEIADTQARITQQLAIVNEKLSEKVGAVKTYLSSDQAQKENKGSSPVIKNTIELLAKKAQETK
jgi:hypothetical protein